jgi:hypothetical protein
MAMYFETQSLVFLSCFFVGMGQGLGQFYRFSAVEIAPPSFKPRAVTYVLSGGVLAAYLGPITAELTVHLLPDHPYLGSYLMVGAIGVLNQLCCLMVHFPSTTVLSSKAGATNQSVADGAGATDGPTNRPMLEIVTEPLFVVSCTVATLAHTIMVMVMSNSTLALSAQGFSVVDSSQMMMLHFGCMFIPGFFTGRLIESYGSFLVAMLGAIVFACSSAVFLSGMGLLNFYLGMSLLGLAWNFSFSAGTVMLTGSYQKSEAADVQAVNDFILFTVAGVGSLISGVVYSYTSWYVLIWVISGMMLLNM